MTYKTPQALEMAVKSAAKAASMDTGRAISGFYFHRLLCRVFSDPDSRFILKGGQGMLARTVDARATRDIDLLSESGELGTALEDLKRAAAIDLDDFVTFEFARTQPIKAVDEYREGLKVEFNVYLGNKRVQGISVDLVVDETPQARCDILSPADRLDLPGLPVFDYRVYHVASALADKLCGILEIHDGRSSSRVKDLVDIAVYASTEKVSGDDLVECLRKEEALRKLTFPARFSVPTDWHGLYETAFRKAIQQAGARESFPKMTDAEKVAARLLNPALGGAVSGMAWDPKNLEWR